MSKIKISINGGEYKDITDSHCYPIGLCVSHFKIDLLHQISNHFGQFNRHKEPSESYEGPVAVIEDEIIVPIEVERSIELIKKLTDCPYNSTLLKLMSIAHTYRKYLRSDVQFIVDENDTAVCS